MIDRNRNLLLNFGVLLVLAVNVKQAVGQCSETDRVANLQNCLDKIKQQAHNTSMFWFGDSYSGRCNSAPESDVECFNPNPDTADSVISRIYNGGAYNLGGVNKFLEIKYTKPSGSYMACGNMYQKSLNGVYDVDPLSSEVVMPWDLHKEPSYDWDYTPGELFTLIFYDVGYLQINSLIVNIPGNNVTAAEVILQYQGPLNPTRNNNPYLFVLYKQSSSVQLGYYWRNILHYRSSANFDLASFVQQNQLTGPVGLNWMQVKGDTYSAGIQHSAGYMSTCARYVSSVFYNSHNIEFLPPNTVNEFTVYVDVTFDIPPIEFNSCCTVYKYPAKKFSLNPIGDLEIKSHEARSSEIPTLTFTMTKAFPNPKQNFKDKIYALIEVDNNNPLFPSEPFLHWLVVNIKNGDVTTGETAFTYAGPAPPDSGPPHVYHYLLFEQDGVLNPDDFNNYTNPNCTRAGGRCRYLAQKAILGENLKLVGASWGLTRNDAYVRFQHLNRTPPRPVDTVCEGVERYTNPCDSPTTTDSSVKDASNRVNSGYICGILCIFCLSILNTLW